MLSSILTVLIVGIVGLVAISVVLAVLGAVLGLAFGLVSFLLFKVVPVLLVGYLLVRLLAPRRRRLSGAGHDWIGE